MTQYTRIGSRIPLTSRCRAHSAEGKQHQIDTLARLPQRHTDQAPARLQQLQQMAEANGNLLAELMETVKCCALGRLRTRCLTA